MSPLASKPNFILMNLILSKKEPFTLKEIVEDLKKTGVLVQKESDVLPLLNRFRENGLIIQRGSKYSLSDYMLAR
ncbi:hypothetical protein SY88_10125 [Clostridiales bacterium PH28_bin88]|nr:hypothetical protein SY88_10125 [Clostridiales bacterium PH28_bin88]